MTDRRIDEVIGKQPEKLIFKDTPPSNCIIVVFGATGDLARKKLFPALYGLERDGLLPCPCLIVGFSHTDRTVETFRAQIRENVAEKMGNGFDEQVWQRLAERLRYHAGDFNDPEPFRRLRERIREIEAGTATNDNRLFYLATPSNYFPSILDNLRAADLLHASTGDDREPWTRLVIEKPFGSDLASCRELNGIAADILTENQIFRVDHYLAKETVQNILIFRFANAIFDPVWNRNHVDHVQITGAETIGIDGRGSFYDRTGVVRDVVQNHLMQVLALIAMEPPISFHANDFHDEKSKVFRSLRPLRTNWLDSQVTLGQYRGYRDEPGVSENSETPTFAALKVFIDTWRWQGVPFYIRAGKRLARHCTEVSIRFRHIPICLFGSREVCERVSPNIITLRIQPDEGISLSFSCKVPGDHLEVGEMAMDFGYAKAFAGKKVRPAYERLLLDCMRGDQTLFAKADALESQWAYLEPILHPEEGQELPVHPYEPGSEGPNQAEDLFRRDSHGWRPLTEPEKD